MKVIHKHPAPAPGSYASLSISPGSKFIGAGYENGGVVLYTESTVWAAGCVYWEVQCVRMGDSYADGMEVLASIEAPDSPVGYTADRLFYVGRING